MDKRAPDLVLRPDLPSGLIVLAVGAAAAAGIVTAILVGDAPAVFAPIVGVGFAALFVLMAGTLYRARIILTQDEIVVLGMFYRQRRQRSHIAEVVRATITVPRGGAGESLFLLGADRRLLLRVSGGAYRREDLDRLLDALGVPCAVHDRPIGPKDFADSYPGLLSPFERHPYRFGIPIAAVITVVLIALVVLGVALSS